MSVDDFDHLDRELEGWVRAQGERIVEALEEGDDPRILTCLGALDTFDLSSAIINRTGIPLIVSKLKKRKESPQICTAAKLLVRKWKAVLQGKDSPSSSRNVSVSPLPKRHGLQASRTASNPRASSPLAPKPRKEEDMLTMVQGVKMKLEEAASRHECDRILRLLSALDRFRISVEVLHETGLGLFVNGLRKMDKLSEEIKKAAKQLVSKWKKEIKAAANQGSVQLSCLQTPERHAIVHPSPVKSRPISFRAAPTANPDLQKKKKEDAIYGKHVVTATRFPRKKVSSLYDSCIRCLQAHVDLLGYVGDIPFDILKPVLIRCTPERLLALEKDNPHFVEHTRAIWTKHCQRKGVKPGQDPKASWTTAVEEEKLRFQRSVAKLEAKAKLAAEKSGIQCAKKLKLSKKGFKSVAQQPVSPAESLNRFKNPVLKKALKAAKSSIRPFRRPGTHLKAPSKAELAARDRVRKRKNSSGHQQHGIGSATQRQRSR